MEDSCWEDVWMKKIFECQNEISTLDPHSYYVYEYKNAEISYWPYIAKWLYEDSINHEVENCLDIGCGYGTLALYCKKLFHCNLFCTDFIDSCISRTLINKYNFFFHVNNIELDSVPWTKPFDRIIFTEVLEHLNFNPVPTLQKIYNLLTEKGCLYLSTPDASSWGKVTKYFCEVKEIPNPNKNVPVINDHIYLFNKDELLDIIDKSGFKIKRLECAPGIMGRHHYNLALTK